MACHDDVVADAAASERLTYHVELTLPRAALQFRDALDETIHRSDRYVGVITGGVPDALGVGILTGAQNDEAAERHAIGVVTAALESLGLADLAASIEVRQITSRPVLAGGVHRVDCAPTLAYRTSMLPDDRVLKAVRRGGPLGEWFAFVQANPDRVLAGRSLGEVLWELFELPRGKPESWVRDAIAELAGYQTSHGIRFQCPCCDHLTLEEPPPGTFAICEICRWEDDNVQFRDPDYGGGANRESLREARDNFARSGSSSPGRGGAPRPPLPHEQPPSS